MKSILTIFFLLLLLSSCSIEKRLYNKGFHVENSFFKKEKVEIELNTDEFLAQEDSKSKELIPLKKEPKEKAKKEKNKLLTDTIYLKSREVLTTKNTKIIFHKTEVKGKDVKTKKRIKLSRDEVISVHFKNGRKVKMEYLQDEIKRINNSQKINWIITFTSLALILSGLVLLLFGIGWGVLFLGLPRITLLTSSYFAKKNYKTNLFSKWEKLSNVIFWSSVVLYFVIFIYSIYLFYLFITTFSYSPSFF